jgi:hypothetical protein
VAVEKLASEKSAKIKTRQEAPQTIFPGRLDIFYLPISAYLRKRDFLNSHPCSRHLSCPDVSCKRWYIRVQAIRPQIPERRIWTTNQLCGNPPIAG